MLRLRGTMLAAMLLVAAACGVDRATRPIAPGDAPSLAKKAPTPAITDVSPTTASMVIGGGSTPFSVTVANPSSNAIYAGISVSATIVQGNASRDAGSAVPNCGGDGDGILRPGTGCAVPLTVAASNSANGAGTLTPGNAKLVISLLQLRPGGETTLDTRTLKVTLTGSVFIADLQLHFTSLEIGSSTLNDYTMTLGNTTGADQSLYVVQGYVVQGAVVHAAGGANVCPGLTGVVPVGGCTFDWHASAQNPQSETGTLVAGPATLRLDLVRSDGVTTALVERREVPVDLTSP